MFLDLLVFESFSVFFFITSFIVTFLDYVSNVLRDIGLVENDLVENRKVAFGFDPTEIIEFITNLIAIASFKMILMNHQLIFIED